MKLSELQPGEYADYYAQYLAMLDPQIELLSGLEKSKETVGAFFKEIPLDKQGFRYEAGKWSIKEVFQHLIDSERIFMHRCFRIGRLDATPLPGFEQNDYIIPSGADQKSLENLLEEFHTSRDFGIALVKSLSPEALAQKGTASEFPVTARGAAFTVLGHEQWHLKIIRERYLSLI
ncbi:MAG: DinB family protein [Bacteroidota bacterium]